MNILLTVTVRKTQTLEQPGVNAPGTANSTPFFPANSEATSTLPLGVPSMTCIGGSLSPT